MQRFTSKSSKFLMKSNTDVSANRGRETDRAIWLS